MGVYYKVLNDDGSAFHGGKGRWHLPRGSRPGKWMPTIDRIEPCRLGYHVCMLGQLPEWLGPAVFEVEVAGEVVDAGDKTVVGRARLVRRLNWDVRTVRLFAADCALRALRAERKAGREPDPRSWAGAYAARKVAQGKMSEDAAWAAADAARAAADAARAAAWAAADAARGAADAAWAAADAARGAAYAAWAAADAARAAAWAAADAARGAAYAAWAAADAARAAAWAAADAARGAADAARERERAWQAKRLGEYLTGKRGH